MARHGGSVAAAVLLALAPPQPARAYDLYPCSSKPSFTELRCPKGSAVACWSKDESVDWICWAQDSVPTSLSGPLAGMPMDVTCTGWPTPVTDRPVQRPYYDGACTLLTPTREALPVLPSPPLTWKEARTKAEQTASRMTTDEKYMLMKGRGWQWPGKGWFDLKKWWYVGNMANVSRLGLPNLNMQDSAGGFRSYWHEIVDTTTLWPSQLCLAATFDPTLVQLYGQALGVEFAGKGANVVLGPSVNVHRGALNGRNFEYLSGEDPYLGAKLAWAWVRGVQSQGVMAVVKHWVFNEQETQRDSQISVVDPKTSWEVYYPPFQAAVNAGVSAAMCSYNKVGLGGRHSCANKPTLHALKDDLGLEGFIQSDWWALHSQTVAQGVDQDMPGISDDGIGRNVPGCKDKCGPPDHIDNATWFDPDQLRQASPADVDESVTRIVASMYHLNVTSSCTPPECEAWFKRNVSSQQHTALARYLAAESIVVLQNRDRDWQIGQQTVNFRKLFESGEDGVLPLNWDLRTLAVVGSVANARPYDPDGQGQGQGKWNQGDYYSGGGSGHVARAFVSAPVDAITRRAHEAGVTVLQSLSNSTTDAYLPASQAQVTIVVAGAMGQEAEDRTSLHLDDGADQLVEYLAANTKTRIVVLLQVPGAVVMPWRSKVHAILVMFTGGQETGNAWADVLFGDHLPAGRLPIMMPETEADIINITGSETVRYTEGLKTSYRNPDFRAAFPFGHGLSWSSFGYLTPEVVDCGGGAEGDVCVKQPVRNSGTVPARTVAQLYLELPEEAGHPAPLLKGFLKTPVIPGHTTRDMIFVLTARDLSFYDSSSNSWVRPATAKAHIGESSRDIRQHLDLDVPGGAGGSGGYMWALAVVLFAAGFFLLALLFYRVKSSKSFQGFHDSSDDESASDSGEDSHA